MTKCLDCQGEFVTTREDHRYEASGLSNVVLVDVEVRRCPKCGTALAAIPCAEELFRTIALAVVRKPSLLSCAEIRFLRKHLGWSSVELADHMGVDACTVSNWEIEKASIGITSDRLLRLMVVHLESVETYGLDELTKIDNEPTPPIELRVHPNARGWELEAVSHGS